MTPTWKNLPLDVRKPERAAAKEAAKTVEPASFKVSKRDYDAGRQSGAAHDGLPGFRVNDAKAAAALANPATPDPVKSYWQGYLDGKPVEAAPVAAVAPEPAPLPAIPPVDEGPWPYSTIFPAEQLGPELPARIADFNGFKARVEALEDQQGAIDNAWRLGEIQPLEARRQMDEIEQQLYDLGRKDDVESIEDMFATSRGEGLPTFILREEGGLFNAYERETGLAIKGASGRTVEEAEKNLTANVGTVGKGDTIRVYRQGAPIYELRQVAEEVTPSIETMSQEYVNEVNDAAAVWSRKRATSPPKLSDTATGKTRSGSAATCRTASQSCARRRPRRKTCP